MGLREQAGAVGTYLRDELSKLTEGCEPLADVRGVGLFVCLEWVSDRARCLIVDSGNVTYAEH